MEAVTRGPITRKAQQNPVQQAANAARFGHQSAFNPAASVPVESLATQPACANVQGQHVKANYIKFSGRRRSGDSDALLGSLSQGLKKVLDKAIQKASESGDSKVTSAHVEWALIQRLDELVTAAKAGAFNEKSPQFTEMQDLAEVLAPGADEEKALDEIRDDLLVSAKDLAKSFGNGQKAAGGPPTLDEDLKDALHKMQEFPVTLQDAKLLMRILRQQPRPAEAEAVPAILSGHDLRTLSDSDLEKYLESQAPSLNTLYWEVLQGSNLVVNHHKMCIGSAANVFSQMMQMAMIATNSRKERNPVAVETLNALLPPEKRNGTNLQQVQQALQAAAQKLASLPQPKDAQGIMKSSEQTMGLLRNFVADAKGQDLSIKAFVNYVLQNAQKPGASSELKSINRIINGLEAEAKCPLVMNAAEAEKYLQDVSPLLSEVFERATQLAAEANSPTVDPKHVLLAMIRSARELIREGSQFVTAAPDLVPYKHPTTLFPIIQGGPFIFAKKDRIILDALLPQEALGTMTTKQIGAMLKKAEADLTAMVYPTTDIREPDKQNISPSLSVETLKLVSGLHKRSFAAGRAPYEMVGVMRELLPAATDLENEQLGGILDSISVRHNGKKIAETPDEFLEVLNEQKNQPKSSMNQKQYHAIQELISDYEAASAGGGDKDKYRRRLDLLLNKMTWVNTAGKLDLKAVQKQLNDDHTGLEQPKKSILEFVAVQQQLEDHGLPPSGKVLGLVGPPGVGKTSLAQSLGSALNRKVVSVAMGGLKDQADLRGHDSVYVGSLHGRIAAAIAQAGTSDPIVILDEVDKISSQEVQAALLELLDPKQNKEWVDKFIGPNVPLDLSNVLFVTTANDLQAVSPPLRDRMEVIKLGGYDLKIKTAIARNHLIEKQAKAAGLQPEQLNITDEGLKAIINGYTLEAGVRNLERQIYSIGAKLVLNQLSGQPIPKKIGPKEVAELLGPPIPAEDRLASTPAEFRQLLEEQKTRPNSAMHEYQYKAIGQLISDFEAAGPVDKDKFRQRLDLLLNKMKWVNTETSLDPAEVKQQLDKDHTGLDEPKQRIVEYVAVQQKLQAQGKPPTGQILGFNGPPGVGKTSLATSLGTALNRKVVRVALGGIKDEVDLRGHSSTYVGALAGRIAQAVAESGSMNPIVVLDEIDKVDSPGVQAAMLELLDPKQNHKWVDKFIGQNVPLDLSKVLFVTTSNYKQQISPPLRDRIDLIDLEGYDKDEKKAIAKNHLIPKTTASTGFSKGELDFGDDALDTIIDDYTREDGVRNLERIIHRIISRLVARQATGAKIPSVVGSNDVREILGPSEIRKQSLKPAKVGMGNGLYVAGPTGGVGRFLAKLTIVDQQNPNAAPIIEFAPGTPSKNFQNMTNDSVHHALNWVTSNPERLKELGFDAEKYKGKKIQITMQTDRGSQMDGDSAGAVMTSAIVSALTGRKFRNDLAITGTITVMDEVLAIGGLKQKLHGAMDAGMKVVFFPEENIPDFERIPERFRQNLQYMTLEQFKKLDEGQLPPDKMVVVPVSDINDVLEYALLPKEGVNVSPAASSNTTATTPHFAGKGKRLSVVA